MVIKMENIQSKRLDYFNTGIFSALNEECEKLQREGKKIYNLSIGTPDFKPPKHITDALCECAKDPASWKYSLTDTPELLGAVCDYYKKRFNVGITPDIITSVHGTQEGMGHLGLSILNEGDVVLLPDPGYPIFEVGAYLGGANIYFYPLLSENKFLPRLDKIPEDVLKRAKMLVLSYPSNPCGAAAPVSVYEEAIRYAKKYDFLIINDNAYSDIIFDGRKGISFLSLDGASDVGAEFFSLSKSFNVTGARISFLIGNKKIIDAVKLLRTQYDFGMFYPVQAAAVAALTGPLENIKPQCEEYQKRRDTLLNGLISIGWDVRFSDGTMFVWLPIPKNYTSSEAFCLDLARRAGVLGTPGTAFGPSGEGYIRFALVKPCEELIKIVEAIKESGILC